jgi:hypothetical protein
MGTVQLVFGRTFVWAIQDVDLVKMRYNPKSHRYFFGVLERPDFNMM